MFKRHCRQCGEEIDYIEFGVGKECSHCGKEMATVNITEVHVAFEDSVYSHICFDTRGTQAFELGIDYQKILLDYELRIGDISNPPYSNANAYAQKYSSATAREKIITKQLNKLNAVPSSAEVFLWLEPGDINGYMNLCYFADHFKRFSKVHLLSPLSFEEISNNNDTPRDSSTAHILVTNINLDECSSKLNSREVEKADYRSGNCDKIVPCTCEWLKEQVLKRANSRYKKFGKLFVDVHNQIKADTGNIVSFDVVAHVVNELVLEWRLKSNGAYMWWGDSSYNNMLCTQSFKLDNFDELDYVEYETALTMVLKAFDVGFTYPLYDILDENATLTFVDEDRTICGRRQIIEFIENDGAERIHVNKQTVTCDILKVAEGERYGVGDKIILLTYECEKELNQHYIVKIDYMESKIYKIKLFIHMDH